MRCHWREHRFLSLRQAAGFTVMLPLVPVIEEVTVSVLVIVREPTVFKVALKVPTPLVNVESEGSTACASLLVKCAVPA